MAKETQISAFISRETKEELERLSRARGLKKGFVVEQALRHYFQVLREIPAEFIIPPRVVVTEESYRKILREIETPSPPAQDLRDLMNGKPLSDDGIY